MSETFHTIVIGGGIAGLACAHRLVRALGPDKVRLLEASDYLGGHVRTTHEAGYQLDWGPNGFLDREPAMLDWIRELGLEGELVQANQAAARRYLMIKGRLVELVGPPKFLLSPALSVAGRARLLMEPLIPPKRGNAPESVYDFARRRIGREAADTLVSAMVLGIFGGDAKQLSLEYCFPRMAAMEREHGSLFRAMLAKRHESRMVEQFRGGGQPQGAAPTAGTVDLDAAGGAARGHSGPMGPGGTLTSLRGGIGRLAERAAESLGDAAQTTCEVTGLERDRTGFVAICNCEGARSIQLRAANVVLAVPAFVTADLVENFSAGLSSKLDALKYSSLAVLCTGLKDAKFYARMISTRRSTLSVVPIAEHSKATKDSVENGFGFLIPPTEHVETMGCLWTSSIFSISAPPGHLLFRTMLGGALHPDVTERTDSELYEFYRRDVLNPLNMDGEHELVRVIRHRRAIPQYGLAHGEVLAAADAAERAHPGLYFTGSAFRGVAMIDCVADARRVADRILAGGA